LEDQAKRSLIREHYENKLQTASPLMKDVMQAFQGQLRRDLVTFAENTWHGDIIPFPRRLINSVRNVVTDTPSSHLLSTSIIGERDVNAGIGMRPMMLYRALDL